MDEPSPLRRIDDARRAIEREREILQAEINAFGRFACDLRTVEASDVRAVGGGTAGAQPAGAHATSVQSVGPAHATVGITGSVAKVRSLFAETVMATPHYDDVYGEHWTEHLRGEFNQDLAAALEHQTTLSPEVKQALLEATDQSIASRRRILGSVEREAELVETARRDLKSIHTAVESILAQPLEQLEFNALRLSRARLLELEAACDELVAVRQPQISGRRDLTMAGIGAFEQYLYDDCAHTYPVLSAVADLGERIDRERRALERSLASVR
ncbi:DUF7260 family protein [Natrarchaeobaculum sulfurireducens]|uniref:DUF7260 domain-containing protein n=1 Tax=Natrarchaeobaculum sulfurireducens TaxID=2044521 RepID=A0A346PAP1_9EURY|nr:hypothetical protein [Natrarchaeobaculum sulfurireducens]AXR76586.1 hypothetical protein AArc1_0242 [Natrarchaeobaculum sulfurireducens]